MSWDPTLDPPPVPVAREPDEPYGPSHEPPVVDLRPYTREELDRLFRGGEREVEEVEARLVRGARMRGGLALRLGQGMCAVQKGHYLHELAFRFVDYARELRIGRSRAYELVEFARDLETRPLLRRAVESGRVKFRAAQEVMPLAVGEAEAYWVEKAATETVRALEKQVASQTDPHAEEPLFRMGMRMEPEDRLLLDEALTLAGRLDPHASKARCYEALAMEYLGEFPADADEVVDGPVTKESWREDLWLLGRAFRRTGFRAELDAARAAAMEAENACWSHMEPAADVPAPVVDFASMTSAKEIDREIRRLVRQDEGWDEIIGHDAYALKASGVHRTLGYASFKQYVEERLKLPYAWVAKRADLEERIWKSPALQEARRQKLGFEKLWMLSFLTEDEIGSWILRAKAMTVIELKRKLDADEDARMRGQGEVKSIVPRSVAYLLAAAIATAKARAGGEGRPISPISDARALAIVAAHFLTTYDGVRRRRKSIAQRVRERDGGWCTTPGCSAHSDDAHHIEYRSQGGHPTAMWNQAAGCRFHHVCVHDFGLRLTGKAPDNLVWTLDGEPFTGR